MAHFDRSERGGRQGHWRRRQHRWNGPEHTHNDNRAPSLQYYDGFGGPGALRVSPRPLPHVEKQDVHMGALDELTLRHMAQDCSALKNQLLRLKNLLQFEDTGSSTDAVEETEDNITALQLEELMKEVRVLKEELKSRDKTIAQLTLQCQQLKRQQEQRPIQGRAGRCQCHHQRTPSALRGDKLADGRTQQQYDKATQTHWRGHSHTPQLLQLSSPCLSEHLRQERLAKILPTEGRNEAPGRNRDKVGAHTDSIYASGSPIADASGTTNPLAPDPDELSLLLSTQLHLNDHLVSGALQGGSARADPGSVAQPGHNRVSRALTESTRKSGTPGSTGLAYPRVLQAPCLHKHVSVPALPRGTTSSSESLRSRGPSGQPANLRTRQLPPPSRGLPCFSTGSQAELPCVGRASLPQPRSMLGLRRDTVATNTTTTNPSLEEADMCQLSTKVTVPPGSSRLPKPKIH